MASSLGIPSLQSELSTALALFKIDMGAFVVGTFMSTLVAGMILQHTLRYFRLFPDDPVYIKIWVVTVVTVQMFSCALYMYSCYDELVTNYANPSIFLQKAYWPATVIPIMAPVNYILAEAFFVRRVYTLGRFYRVIALFSMALITASLGFFIRIPISTIKDSSTTEVQNTAGGWEPTVGSALLLAGDLQLTAVLIYFLRENRSGIKRTNSMIDTLIVYAISSGSLICALNVVTLVLSLVFAHNSILAASSMVLETAYTSSFIVALNTRHLVRARGELDGTNLGGTVLGEKGLRKAGVNAMVTPIVFATAHPQSQLTSGGSTTTAQDTLDLENLSAKGDTGRDEYKRDGRGAVTV